MKRRILSFALVVIMIMTLMPFGAFAANAKITITTQPQSQTVTEGSDAVFTIEAQLAGLYNDHRLNYIWIDADGVNFSGMDAATIVATILSKNLGIGKTLTLEDVSLDMDGMHICCVVVTIDDLKSNITVSNIATLTVALREPCEVHDFVCCEAVDPTCCSDGNLMYWQCSFCHRIYFDEEGMLEATPEDVVIPADPNAHALEHHDRIDATCKANGNIEYWECTLCGNIYDNAAGEGDAMTAADVVLHSSDVPHQLTLVPAKAATCTEKGNIEYYVCEVCGGYFDANGRKYLLKNAVVTDIIPHTFDYAYDEFGHWQYCTMCEMTVEGSYSVHNDKLQQATCCQKAICECGYEHGDYGDHSYTAAVTAATCTEQGYTTYTCKHCGDSYKADYKEVLGHDFGAWTVTKAPTCTENGTETRYCSRCDATETRVAFATGHDYAAVVTAPTCTEQGYTTYTCKHCGDSYKTDYVSALGHTPVTDPAVAPTCTATGLTEGSHCKVCGEILVARETVDALGHDFGAWTVTKAPTCTENGTETRYCSRCDATETRVVYAAGHDYTAVVTAPTCTKGGYTTYTCACGDSYTTNYIPTLGHDFGEWTVTKAPTCTEKGVETRYCSRCDATETREVEALGHDYVAVVTAPTCTEKGYTTYTCSRCDDSYKTDYVLALGHSFGEWTVTTAPTCTEKGVETRICPACGETETREVAALGHSFGEWTVTTAPTCTEKGVETRSCPVCGETETREVEALGHDYEATVTAPTCTEQGYTTYTCACGDSYKDNFVEALDHDYVDGKCSRCEELDPNYVPELVNPFVDVSEGSVYYDAILWAYYHTPKQITGGFDATHFVPSNPCTRAQVVTFLWRAAGEPEPTAADNPFSDVSAVQANGNENPYYKAILWASENGITTGYGDGTFRPNDTVTRAQFVTFLWRYEDEPETSGSINGFTDAGQIAAPYQQAVAWAVENGITTGYEDGSFRPNNTCTRWAVVLFMYRDMA